MPKGVSFRILLFCLCIPAILLMAGCADDLRNRNLFDCGAGDAVISYSVADVILTRDGNEEDFESVVDHAYLLFYASDASVTTDVPVAAVRAESESNGLKFKMPIMLHPDTDYQMIAIANADSYTPAGYGNYGAYLEAWCNTHTNTDYSPIHFFYDSQISERTNLTLPMSGEIKDGSIFRFSLDNGVYKIPSSLSFRRKVARIDVANIVKNGFNVEGVYLCNWRDAVDVYPSEEIVGNKVGALHGVLSKESASEEQFILMPQADTDGIQRLNNSIYCFPSVSYESYLGDEESTALIIKAKYGQDTEPTYYRVNVGSKGNISEVKANTKYLVTIQSVKGSGAPTPEDAYAAKESPIVLSVVEDWDLDGSNFAMDDKGNFMVISSSSLDFEGDDLEKREIKVLTSKGLDWSASYVPDNDDSSDAFLISKLSESSVVIGPAETNVDTYPLIGKCKVTAQTEAGDMLSVNISLSQQPKPYKLEIPENIQFTIIPQDSKRVKIDYNNKTIEIDAFDPDCFNSFIDIPFTIYKKSVEDKEQIAIYPPYMGGLSWPIEGAISSMEYSDYYYCFNSFANSKPTLYSKSKDKELSQSEMPDPDGLYVGNGDRFFISVGAMAPDDPPIEREINIYHSKYGEERYKLIIKPSSAIMDDVVLTDQKGNHWLIFDRNMQDSSNGGFVGLNSDGRKYQAYNFSYIPVRNYNQNKICIPFKYSSNNVSFTEDQHFLYLGTSVKFGEKSKLDSSHSNERDALKYSWFKNFQRGDNPNSTSPFYDASNFEKWNYPSTELLQVCASKMRVSKLRMFLVSDIPVKNGRNKIPVCCYWPFYGQTKAQSDMAAGDCWGYFSSESKGSLDNVVHFFCNKTEILTITSEESGAYGLSRLVRQVSDEELSVYKQNYLGYGSQPFKLILCHPDTYTSDGWIPY